MRAAHLRERDDLLDDGADRPGGEERQPACAEAPDNRPLVLDGLGAEGESADGEPFAKHPAEVEGSDLATHQPHEEEGSGRFQDRKVAGEVIRADEILDNVHPPPPPPPLRHG